VKRVARRLNDLLARVAGDELARAGSVGVRIDEEWVERFLWFERLLEQVEGVEGDVVECGVAGGSSLAMLASLVRRRGGGRHLFGLDNWRGLPEPQPMDSGPGSVAERGMFSWASPELVRRELRAHGFRADEFDLVVTLIPGPFGDTLPRLQTSPALVHVDADLYESYRLALVCLWPRLTVGGIVAFDEYEEHERWPGARRAVDEFLAGLAAGSAELARDDRIGKWYARKTG
jgi:O-methyltransferase